MYCRRCGKEIDYDAEYCIECSNMAREKAQPVEETYYQEPQQETYYQAPQQNYYQPQSYDYTTQKPANTPSRTAGLGKGITGAIFAFIALIFASVSAEMMLYEDGIALVLAILGIGFSIPALVCGKGAISIFKLACRNNHPRPIPTLICGIFGVAMGATSLLCGVIAFFGLLL